MSREQQADLRMWIIGISFSIIGFCCIYYLSRMDAKLDRFEDRFEVLIDASGRVEEQIKYVEKRVDRNEKDISVLQAKY